MKHQRVVHRIGLQPADRALRTQRFLQRHVQGFRFCHESSSREVGMRSLNFKSENNCRRLGPKAILARRASDSLSLTRDYRFSHLVAENKAGASLGYPLPVGREG